MKIVGFEANNGVRLGVVDGDSVVDLQAVDANVPADLAEVLRREQRRPLVDWRLLRRKRRHPRAAPSTD